MLLANEHCYGWTLDMYITSVALSVCFVIMFGELVSSVAYLYLPMSHSSQQPILLHMQYRHTEDGQFEGCCSLCMKLLLACNAFDETESILA